MKKQKLVIESILTGNIIIECPQKQFAQFDLKTV